MSGFGLWKRSIEWLARRISYSGPMIARLGVTSIPLRHPAQLVGSVLCGLVLITPRLRGGEIREHYGAWEKLIMRTSVIW